MQARSAQPNLLKDTYLPSLAEDPVSKKTPTMVDALKASCKLMLLDYVRLRKPSWDSKTGQAADWLKLGLGYMTRGYIGSQELTAYTVLDECDLLRTEIDGADTYDKCVNLVNSLYAKAAKAKGQELPFISNPALRTDTYLAIRALVLEIIKLNHQEEYQVDLEQTAQKYEKEKVDLQNRKDNSQPIEEAQLKRMDALLAKLVLLGNRRYFTEAFDKKTLIGSRIFKEFKPQHAEFYLSSEERDRCIRELNRQMVADKSCGFTDLDITQKPNIYYPMHFQPNYATLFLASEPHNASLDAWMTAALKNPNIKPDSSSFRIQYDDDKLPPLDQKIDPNTTKINAHDAARLANGPAEKQAGSSPENTHIQPDDLQADTAPKQKEEEHLQQASVAPSSPAQILNSRSSSAEDITHSEVSPAMKLSYSAAAKKEDEEHSPEPARKLAEVLQSAAQEQRPSTPIHGVESIDDMADLEDAVDLSSDASNSLSTSSATLFTQINPDGDVVPSNEQRQEQEQNAKPSSQKKQPQTQRRRKK